VVSSHATTNPSKSPPARHDASERSGLAARSIRRYKRTWDSQVRTSRADGRKHNDIFQSTEKANLVFWRHPHCKHPLHCGNNQPSPHRRRTNAHVRTVTRMNNWASGDDTTTFQVYRILVHGFLHTDYMSPYTSRGSKPASRRRNIP